MRSSSDAAARRLPGVGNRRPHGSRVGRVASAAVAGALLLPLVACAPEPDPGISRDALKEVTAEPVAPDAIDEYDAETHPEPIVEPLECTDYLVVTARGTGEPPKKQLLGPIARAIASARPDAVTRLDLDYPADTEINIGGTLGARTLIDTLNVQAETCPDQRSILLGYSQGALVIGDALAGPEARLVGAQSGELTDAASAQVLAVVFYGNPRFVGADPMGSGTFDPEVNGLLPRPPGSLDAYADRMRDYCVDDDFICQATLSMEESGHVAYYDNGMTSDGAAFVITRLDPVKKPKETRSSEEEDAGAGRTDTDRNGADRSGADSSGADSTDTDRAQ